MKLPVLLILSLIIFSCSSKPPKNPRAQVRTGNIPVQTAHISMESKQLASELESNFVTEIDFKKGSFSISKNAQAKIKYLIQKMQKVGKVDEAKVITWADQEYPSVNTSKLSQNQVKLARDRNTALKKYIDSLDKKLKIEAVSMAERPSFMDKIIASDDVRIKRSLETAGIPNTDTSVKTPSKASKSIIIFMMHEKK